MRIIVTSGSRYLDIDAYACCVAYAELLRLLGNDAVAASAAPPNNTVTASLRGLAVQLQTHLDADPDDRYVIADLSNPDFLAPEVDVERVTEVYDHHLGFESFWHGRIGDKSRIDFIGAAATLIYERWAEEGRLAEMSRSSAELLAAAILDNTLNFQAGVTTDRDRAAYAALAEHAGLDDDWVAGYFSECQQTIMSDLEASLTGDTKSLKIDGFADTLHMGQLVIWDAGQLLDTSLDMIRNNLSAHGGYWAVNIVSISEGRSYFLADNAEVKDWLGRLLGVRFDSDTAVADRLWLRKEIMKASLSHSG